MAANQIDIVTLASHAYKQFTRDDHDPPPFHQLPESEQAKWRRVALEMAHHLVVGVNLT